MYYKYVYKTPDEFSDMIMISDGETLIELYFKGDLDEKRRENGIGSGQCEDPGYEICGEARAEFNDVIRWLNIYFKGEEPDFKPAYKINGSTIFRNEVIAAMMTIPYGESSTYNTIAKSIAKKRGIEKMSAQAVGGAVGWNPISIIIPCHRVLGSDGSLTGYGGGIKNKAALLKLEGNSNFRP